ncbi:MAG: response regulator [Candidatus Scalindua sp. SCAELEC01]|nr:MAG: response regulator [Candidatus Scalindua sp. SCAELEC01]
MKKRILFVDDEQNLLDGYKRTLRNQRNVWDLDFVCNVDTALTRLENERYDVIVSDVMMPGKSGLEFLEILQGSEKTRQTPVIIVTGCNDNDLKSRALGLGAMDLLNKPVEKEDLLARLKSMIRLKSYQDKLKDQNRILEERVSERTAELKDSRFDIIWRLGKLAEFRDEDTGNHVLRVGSYCRTLAETLGKDRNFIEMIFLTSTLHDIGKVGVPDSILLKCGKLDPEEWIIMKQHSEIGAEIFNQDAKTMQSFFSWCGENSDSHNKGRHNPLHKMAASIAMSHHERWDGKGYPKGLLGSDIPLEARIVAVADVFDALSSVRPYKKAFPESKVLEIMGSERGNHFDPDVYNAFEKSFDKMRIIQAQFTDNNPESKIAQKV